MTVKVDNFPFHMQVVVIPSLVDGVYLFCIVLNLVINIIIPKKLNKSVLSVSLFLCKRN